MATHLQPPTEPVGKWYRSAAPEEKAACVSEAGVFHSLFVQNQSGSTVYVFVYDDTSATGVPIAGPFKVAAHDHFACDYPTGRGFTTGLYVASSSDDSPYTATTTSDLWIEVGYTTVKT